MTESAMNDVNHEYGESSTKNKKIVINEKFFIKH